MLPSFSTDADAIAALKDDDLRELVGMLCEAELRREGGYNGAAVRYSGHQDAADGGVDVGVQARELNYTNGYVPKATTRIQVKVTDMRPACIKKEMCPKGILLPSIAELAKANGAYIIVSAKASVTHSRYGERLAMMRKCLGGLPVEVDYYDGKQIAKWVSDYPALVSWVKARLGRALNGWEGFGNWARVSERSVKAYKVDDGILLKKLGSNQKPWKGISAIHYLRSSLRKPKASVRLVGISGVGKTRFVQALFEDGVGEDQLNRFEVFYAGSAEMMVPTAGSLLRQLQAADQGGVIIIDNCSSELHRELTELLQAGKGDVRLLTIEYDIKGDDLPEGSEALKLAPGSEKLVAEVLKRLLPKLTAFSCRQIAKVAGGNFRVAKAIGESVKEGEDISMLQDETLFTRIFHQRRGSDQQLLEVAELLALVYSFNKDTEGIDPELKVLADLGELSLKRIRKAVGKLIMRDLVQERGHWGALLPLAIANRLVGRSLTNYSVRELNECFAQPGRLRMLKSFANRLGYLPHDEGARAVVRSWFSEGGVLSDLYRYEREHWQILRDAAVVCEEETLTLVERWTASTQDREQIGHMYRKESVFKLAIYLAYRPKMFERSLAVLLSWYKVEGDENKLKNWRNSIGTFFQLYLSGTTVEPAERMMVLQRVILQYAEDKELVRVLLGKVFEGRRVIGHGVADDEKDRKDHGYLPKTGADVANWYNLHLDLLKMLIYQGGMLREFATEAFESSFTNLYCKDAVREKVLELIEVLDSTGGWTKGWLTVSRSLKQYGTDVPAERADEMRLLIIRFESTDLMDRIGMYLHFTYGDVFEIINVISGGKELGFEALSDKASLLGKEVATKKDALLFAFRGLLETNNGLNSGAFGEAVGEALATDQVFPLLQELLEGPIEANAIHYESLQGLIRGLFQRDDEAYHQIIELVLADEGLRHHMMPLQLSHPQDRRDLDRLHALIGQRFVEGWHHRLISNWVESMPEADLSIFISKVDRLSGEHDWALLCCYRWLAQQKENGVSELMQSVIFEVIVNFTSGQEALVRLNNVTFYLLKSVVEKVLVYDGSFPTTVKLLKAFTGSFYLSGMMLQIVSEVAKHQPRAILKVFVEGTTPRNYWGDGFKFAEHMRPVICGLPLAVLANWLQEVPLTRSRSLAYCISPFSDNRGEILAKNWEPLALFILDKTEATEEVLGWFHDALRTDSLVGMDKVMSREICLPVVQRFLEHEHQDVVAWAEREVALLSEEMRAAVAEDEGRWKRTEEPRFE